MEKTSIKNWAEDDRPREKLLFKGTSSLSNSELLAILISTGTREKSAVDVAKELLQTVNNDLHKLSRLTVKEILHLKIKGIGQVKAINIAAALELGLRRDAFEKKKDVILKSKDIADYLQSILQHKQHEIFVVIYLNQSRKVLHHEIISEGGITGTIADARIILRKALEHHATSIILSHNHPSGNLNPSRQDEELTRRIKEAAKYFDIAVDDHIIVSDEGYYSFADAGLI
jgi:DNA repair protein RadC